MDLISIQRNDIENDIERQRQRHFISRNWKMIGYKKRIKLILSVLVIAVPLIAYIIFCASEVLVERTGDLHKYKIGSDGLSYDKYDPIQVKYHDDLESTSKANNPDAYYVEVTVGAVLEKIKNIESATSSYEGRMQLYFKFDKDEFREMFRHYARNVLADQIITDYYAESGETLPVQAFSYDEWIDDHYDYFEYWVDTHDREYYPGETPSNVLTDKETMFVIGNGEFVPDTLGTLKELEEVQYYDEKGNLRTMCYQKIRFSAKFEKAFDSVRYPLDSVQFKMYILPTMDADYIRYVPDTSTDSEGTLVSGFTPYFGVTSGYRLINETDEMKNFTLRLNYYYDTNNDPAVHFEDSVRTQLEIIVRANRAGMSLFLQAFINLDIPVHCGKEGSGEKRQSTYRIQRHKAESSFRDPHTVHRGDVHRNPGNGLHVGCMINLLFFEKTVTGCLEWQPVFVSYTHEKHIFSTLTAVFHLTISTGMLLDGTGCIEKNGKNGTEAGTPPAGNKRKHMSDQRFILCHRS